jgi:DNA-binding GntR family transcriptional regulator
MYEEASLALSRLPGFDATGAGNYRLPAIAQQSRVHLASAEEEIRLAKAPPIVAAHLGVEPEAPLLKLDRIVVTGDQRPVEWRIGFCHLPEKAVYAALMR